MKTESINKTAINMQAILKYVEDLEPGNGQIIQLRKPAGMHKKCFDKIILIAEIKGYTVIKIE